MSRVYKILPNVDDDFHPALGFVMFIMAIIMITSLFNYRSLIQALVMIYTSYIGLTYKKNIQKYISRNSPRFTPVMAPYSKRPTIQTTANEGYEEDSENEKNDLDVKCDSPPSHSEDSEELDETWNNTNICQ